MRIVCDSCSAKYQIADEKIAGKLFRVRCKKCSNMIMVDGTQLGGSVAAAAGVATSDAGQAVWYVVIDGSQTGPMNEDELAAQVAQGLIEADTYAWKEGMADWLRMSDVPGLAHLVPSNDGFGGEATQVVSSEERPVAGGAASASGAFSVERLTDSSLGTAEPEAPVATAPPAAASPGAASRVSGSGLLASAAADSARSPLSGSAAPRAAAAAEEGGGFTAERNESSVLFSLSDLTAPKSQPRGGDAVPRTEGSGLIDIRTLASAQAALAPPTESDAGAASPGAIAAPAPTMAPMALPPRRQSMAPYIALGALMVVIVLLLVALLMNRDDPNPVVAAEPTNEAVGTEQAEAPAAEEPTAPAAEVAPEPETEVAAAPPVEGSGAALVEGSGAQPEPAEPAVAAEQEQELAANTPADEEADDDREAAREARADAAREAARNEPEPERAEPTPEPSRAEPEERRAERNEPEQAPSTATPRREDNRDSDAVAAALAAIQGSSGEAAAPRANTPAEPAAEPEPTAPAAPTTLGRSEVQSAVRRYNSRVARCTEYGDPGTYRVTFSIQRDGSVSGVSPENSDDVSNCVAGVVRAMTFPRFTGDPIPVTYPFRLN